MTINDLTLAYGHCIFTASYKIIVNKIYHHIMMSWFAIGISGGVVPCRLHVGLFWSLCAEDEIIACVKSTVCCRKTLCIPQCIGRDGALWLAEIVLSKKNGIHGFLREFLTEILTQAHL